MPLEVYFLKPISAVFHRLILVSHSFDEFFSQLLNRAIRKNLRVPNLNIFQSLHKLFYKFYRFQTVLALLGHMKDECDFNSNHDYETG